MLSGKAGDMKNGIVQYGNIPKVVLINMPRSSGGFISYSGIEQIKDMFFFSGKYEGGMICGKCPHVVIFANEPPDEGMMSMDRWVITAISN